MTMTTTYSINLTDSDSTPAWMSLCTSATPGAQDSGRVRYTVTTEQPEALEDALEADDSVIEYAVAWQSPTADQIEAAQAIGWDDYWDPSMDDDSDAARIAAHESDGESWDMEISEALSATTEAEQTAAIERASRIESEWGDDPQTRRVRDALGLAR